MRFSTLALAAGFFAPFASAKAVGIQTYDVCGGSYGTWSGFAFCASVQVSAVAKSPNVWTVAMQIANLSGTNGSYDGSLFAQIGLDNVLGSLLDPASILVTQGGSTVCSNTTNNQSGSASCWSVKQDQAAAGGVNVDFLGNTSSGVNLAVASSCSGTNNYIYSCLGSAPVTISFDVNSDFNPAMSGDVYIKAQGAPGSTECETGTAVQASQRCIPVTATPEPATLAMFGTGLAALAAKGRRRKKSGEVDLGA